MSTLLTPIVTQLELDRDRFKELINGDENATVQLEERTEKSIAGQVKDRIDGLSVSLTGAVSAAEAARDASQTAAGQSQASASAAATSQGEAFTSATEAAYARDLTVSYKDDAETSANTATSMRDQVVNIKGDIDTIYADIQTTANNVDVAANNAASSASSAATSANNASDSVIESNTILAQIQTLAEDIEDQVDNSDYLAAAPVALYPRNLGSINQASAYFVASTPLPYSSTITHSGRTFTVEQDVAGTWTQVASSPLANTDLSISIDLSGLDSAGSYRWFVKDKYTYNDSSPAAKSIETRVSAKNEFSFATPETVSTPTVSFSDRTLTVDGVTFSNTPTSAKTVISVFSTNGIPLTEQTINYGDTLDLSFLSVGTYDVYARVGSGFPDNVESQWATISIDVDSTPVEDSLWDAIQLLQDRVTTLESA